MVDLEARDATESEILAVHDARVLDIQRRLAERGGGWADQDTYVTASSPRAALRAAGGTLRALEAVAGGETASAFAAVRPPGHHATASSLMGFCLLNNVAMAAAAARRMGLRRVAIVDWDVHHGNGTQAIFNEDPELLYVSTHASPFYPGTGAVEESGVRAARGTKVNVPLPYGAGDTAYAAVYDEIVLPALERFEPEIVLVSCGWDAHTRDPLAPLGLSTAGYTAVARRVRDAAGALCGGRIVVTLEGGYDTHALAWCASALCELLLGDEPQPDPAPVPVRPEPDVAPVIAVVRAEIGLA